MGRLLKLIIGWLSGSCLACLVAGAIIRRLLARGQGFWLVTPEIFVRRDQNLDLPLPLVGLIAVVSGIALATLALAIARAAPQSQALLVAIVGIGIGGSFANAIEAVTIGSVTDFLAIEGSGIFSAGDIAYLVCGAFLPMALDRAIRSRSSMPVRVAIGVAAVAAVGVTAFSRGHRPLLIAVVVAAISIEGIALLGRAWLNAPRFGGRRPGPV